MAYFTKQIYDRKQDWANRNASESIRILSEKTGIDAEKLECVRELSKNRHEIHSMDRKALITRNDGGIIRLTGAMSYVEFACDPEPCVIDQVNRLALIADKVPYIIDPEVSDSDDPDSVFEYYDLDITEIAEEDLSNSAFLLIENDWEERIDAWSESVRRWFWEINEKYGTTFPD